MLFNKPVTHSLEEDLREFNLLSEESGPSASPPQVKVSDEKGGDYAGPPSGTKPDEKGYEVNVGDKAGGDRYNVVVRPDGKFVAPSRAEDEEVEGETVQETARTLPPFLAKKLAEKQRAMESEAVAEAEAARAEVLDRAQQVIEAYYASNEQLTAEELQIVIEAYAEVTSAYDTMLEEVTTQLESIVEAADAGQENDDSDDDEDEKAEEAPACPAPKKAKYKDAAMESVTPTIGRARRVLAESGGNDLDEIVSDLRSLEESLNVESPRAASLTRHAKVIEGFEALGSVCETVVLKIDEILRTEAGVAEGEDYDVDGEDARVQVASFIASIAESAQEQLTLLAKGKIDDATATENLARCQYDLEQAKEHMKAVAA
jgi:hypothetical protein